MINAMIFDLDGVICHTDKHHYAAWKQLADELGIHFDERINNRLRGVSRMASLEIVLERSASVYTAAEKEAFAERKNAVYRSLLSQMSREDLSAEVWTTLEELRRRGYKLAIGSSSRNAKYILERVELADYFDAVSDGTNITLTKPNPEVFLKAAEMLGLPPRECVVVEDAIAGIEAAAAGGFKSVGIGEAARLGAADWSIGAFTELLAVINNIVEGSGG
jgi:beta-phosphoglucomutase